MSIKHAILFVLTVLAVGTVNAASFDCSASRLSRVESAICSNSELSVLDERLAESFKKGLGEAQYPATLRSAQRAWLSARDTCTTVECLKDAYLDRIAQLAPQLGKPAAPQPEKLSRAHSDEAGQKSIPMVPATQPLAKQAVPSVKGDSPDVQKPSGDISDYVQVALILYGLVVLAGIIMGWRGKAVIFRNFNDLALVFGTGVCVVAAIAASAILNQDSTKPILSIFLLVTATALFIWVIVRTYQDNRSILIMIVALITKLSISALFIVNVLTLISSGGSSQSARVKNRATAVAFLMMLIPIIYKLVKDKSGIWAPADLLNRYQRSRIGL